MRLVAASRRPTRAPWPLFSQIVFVASLQRQGAALVLRKEKKRMPFPSVLASFCGCARVEP